MKGGSGRLSVAFRSPVVCVKFCFGLLPIALKSLELCLHLIFWSAVSSSGLLRTRETGRGATGVSEVGEHKGGLRPGALVF